MAAELGLSRQRALQLRQREDFPEPVGEISQGAIWDLDDIRRWVTMGPRSSGRPSASAVARTFGNRFVVEEFAIAIGNYSDVYRGIDRRDGLPVAVKVHRRLDEFDARIVSKYRHELPILEALSHPNLMPLLAYGETSDGDLWLAMPLATGNLVDLQPLVSRSPGAIADVMRQICAGLGYAHQQQIVHRDIRPDNILRRDDGVWVLSDFGLAARTDVIVDAPNSADLPHWYTAPEQWDNPRRADQRSDTYSMGKILQELATGNPPVSAMTPHLFKSVVDQATDPNAADRFSSAADFARAINRSLTATQELAPWADPELAAEILRDRAKGSATPPEELFRILQWAERLHEQNEEEMRALTRVLPWLSADAISMLATQDPESFERVFERFGRHLEVNRFPFEYCDEFSDFGRRAVDATASVGVLTIAIRFLVLLGYRNDRWYVRDVLLDMLAHLQDPRQIAAAADALTALDRGAVSWHLSEFALRAMPQYLRDAVLPWLGDLSIDTATRPVEVVPPQ